MILTNADEALDTKPSLYLDDRQIKLLGIDAETASIGQSIQLCAMATVTSISQDNNENGVPCNRMTFELSNMAIEEKEEPKSEDAIDKMYPNSPKKA